MNASQILNAASEAIRKVEANPGKYRVAEFTYEVDGFRIQKRWHKGKAHWHTLSHAPIFGQNGR